MPPLPSHLIPQADDPERLIALGRHIAEHGASSLPDDFKGARDLAYYRNALRMLGWTDEHGIPTEAVLRLPVEEADLRAVFRRALESSDLGRRWLAYAEAISCLVPPISTAPIPPPFPASGSGIRVP